MATGCIRYTTHDHIPNNSLAIKKTVMAYRQDSSRECQRCATMYLKFVSAVTAPF
jgi:hypothetical protein